MEYVIDNTVLYALIDEQVSLVADEAYGDNGVSLYDSVVLTEKDRGKVEGFIGDSVSSFVARAYDICKLSGNSIVFNVPDFDTSMENLAKDEITRYIVFNSCTEIFRGRRAQVVPEYEAKTMAAIGKAVTLLKSRKSPSEL